MSNVSLKDIEYNLGDIVRELLNLANDVNTNIHTIGLLYLKKFFDISAEDSYVF